MDVIAKDELRYKNVDVMPRLLWRIMWLMSWQLLKSGTRCYSKGKLSRRSFLQHQLKSVSYSVNSFSHRKKTSPFTFQRIPLLCQWNFAMRFLWTFLDLLCKSLHTFASSQHFYLSSKLWTETDFLVRGSYSSTVVHKFHSHLATQARFTHLYKSDTRI